MKRFVIMAMVMVLLLVGLGQAQQKMDESARKFNILTQLGIKKLATVKEDQGRNYTLIYISSVWWKKQTESMKRDVVGGGMELAKIQKRDVIVGVYVVDKVSLDYLAFGSLKTGEIKIYK